MNTFDRHLLREWLRILGLVLLATIGLLVVQVMLDDLRDLRKLDASLQDQGMYFLVTMPSFLALVLPLALLVSLLYALGRMHRAHEFTAMRAVGVGFGRLMRPIWIIGAFCCGLMWLLNATVVPWSVEESRALYEQLELRQQADMPQDQRGAVRDVVFDNPEARRTWFINSYSRFSKRARGVTVATLDATHRDISRIVATEARRLEAGGWEFVDGWEMNFDRDSGDAVPPRRFARKTFPEFNEDPALMLLIDRKPEDLSFRELRVIRQYFESTGSPKHLPYAIRYFGLIADTLSPLIVIAMAIPFAVSGVRVNPAVGVSKSIGLFFLYYVLTTIGRALAIKEFVPPELAAWIPNACLAALASWHFWRLR